MANKTVKFTFYLEPKLHHLAKLQAHRENKPTNQFIIDCLQEIVKESSPNPKAN